MAEPATDEQIAQYGRMIVNDGEGEPGAYDTGEDESPHPWPLDSPGWIASLITRIAQLREQIAELKKNAGLAGDPTGMLREGETFEGWRDRVYGDSEIIDSRPPGGLSNLPKGEPR